MLVPSSYSRIVARELRLQERDLPLLLRGTDLPVTILLPGDVTHITTAQQMRVLENAHHMAGTPQERTTYRAITGQLISDLAVRHLRDTTMTAEAVSTLLDYYDTAAFHKAFHRWYGQSPSDYRCSIRNAV